MLLPKYLRGSRSGVSLLLPHRRELLVDGRPVKLGGRAFDVLMALIEARGAVVSKNALMARVWRDRIVEENNLQWQIPALRAAFGADRNLIRTVSGATDRRRRRRSVHGTLSIARRSRPARRKN
jgi:DNA-binding winged helix-turn-helix (wHTH) protein